MISMYQNGKNGGLVGQIKLFQSRLDFSKIMVMMMIIDQVYSRTQA